MADGRRQFDKDGLASDFAGLPSTAYRLSFPLKLLSSIATISFGTLSSSASLFSRRTGPARTSPRWKGKRVHFPRSTRTSVALTPSPSSSCLPSALRIGDVLTEPLYGRQLDDGDGV